MTRTFRAGLAVLFFGAFVFLMSIPIGFIWSFVDGTPYVLLTGLVSGLFLVIIGGAVLLADLVLQLLHDTFA